MPGGMSPRLASGVGAGRSHTRPSLEEGNQAGLAVACVSDGWRRDGLQSIFGRKCQWAVTGRHSGALRDLGVAVATKLDRELLYQVKWRQTPW